MAVPGRFADHAVCLCLLSTLKCRCRSCAKTGPGAEIIDAVNKAPGALLAHGRMADVFAAGPGLVLRR